MKPLLLALLALVPPPGLADDRLARARAAEARLDPRAALELFLALADERPDDALLQQKVAQQYSDLVPYQPDPEAMRRQAERALHHAERAVALEPDNAVNVLSVAVCYGRLALLGDTRTKVAHSRLVKAMAERALQLDPHYAWAHHLLGRWHREVAELSGAARFAVRLFYGGLPAASPAEAVRHLERAAVLEPQVPSHAVELGFAYAAVGRPHDARREWLRAQELPSQSLHDDPAKQRARRALAASDQHERDGPDHERRTR
jgi:tetratricopeptide (TPR) repeat protein